MRYDQRHRYDAYGRSPGPMPLGWYPGAFWAGTPMYGWGMWGWPPEAPLGYGVPRDFPPRRPPERSGAYGRGGDRELREWLQREGYDVEYSIPPHFARRARRHPGYDRGW